MHPGYCPSSPQTGESPINSASFYGQIKAELKQPGWPRRCSEGGDSHFTCCTGRSEQDTHEAKFPSLDLLGRASLLPAMIS